MKHVWTFLFVTSVAPVLAGEGIDLGDLSASGAWGVRDGWLVPTDLSSIDGYSGEGPRIVLPRTISGDFAFSCEFTGPESSGAGGPVVYFGLRPDGTGYAFRHISHWGTAVLHRIGTDGLFRQVGYATGVALGPGEVHSLAVRVQDGRATVTIDGKTPIESVQLQEYRGGGLALACQVRPVQFRRLSLSDAEPSARATVEDPVAAPAYQVVSADAGRGGYQAFPGLCRLKNGDLLCVFYAGWGHVSRPGPQGATGGAIALCRSSDEGKTWSDATIVLDTSWDDRDPAVWECDDGTVVVSAVSVDWTQAKPGTKGWCYAFLAMSSDGGKTFSAADELHIGTDRDITVWTEPRRLANGDWLWPVYRNHYTETTTGFLRSTDGGKTWGEINYLDPASKSTDEPDICQFPDGTLFCAMRPTSQPHMWGSFSRDHGRTWSPLEPLPFYGHCANLLHTKSGLTLLGHRDPGMTLQISRDEAKTWPEAVMIDPAGGAYSQMVELDNDRVLVVYYTEGGRSQIRAQMLSVADGKLQRVEQFVRGR